MLRRVILFGFLLLNISPEDSLCQSVDTVSFAMNPRFSFYSGERKAEMILHIPQALIWDNLNIEVSVNQMILATWKGVPGNLILRIPIDLQFDHGQYEAAAVIKSSSGRRFRALSDLTILKSKPNEVKTDRLTGGLIVAGRLFFPFGFYCYSPVYPTLPEEEAVKGFNMMSPYQKILSETLNERRAYMDRCAQLGMMVHYNLLSVSGGGGISSSGNIADEAITNELLKDEIRNFMDHPALLAWYISDEPNGRKISPEKLEEIYRLIKSIDPWHPVSIVFMAPFLAARRYANALDIVMADPYPVPNNSILQVGEITSQLRAAFQGDKPVWIVPQSFGGGEHWEREPTIQEIRVMTYQAVISGATGIQYFIRHGLNSFPKSTAMWGEAGKMAIEISEIAPWLLSDEKPPKVSCSSVNVNVKSYVHNGRLMIIAVNKNSSPLKTDISVSGSAYNPVSVLFDNRKLQINSGSFTDYLGAYGSQVYLIETKKQQEAIKAYKGNIIKDPGFEDNSSPGVPSSCYAWNEGDRGSTYFLDTREHLEGNHSLRMITPQTNMGTRLRFFPIGVSKGRKYVLSVWAKTDTASYHWKTNKTYFELGLGEYGIGRFYPGNTWQQFVTYVTIPSDTIPSEKANVILRLPGQGTVWFDMIQAFEATEINRSVNPSIKSDLWQSTY